MPSLIVAGAGSFARALAALASSRGGLEIAAFAVDPEHRAEQSIDGVPIEDIDVALETFDPATAAWLVGVVDFRRRMAGRARVVERIVEKGHSIRGFIDPRAAIDTDAIDSTATVFAAATIGPGASVGPASVLAFGAIVSHHTSIGECCYLAPGVTVSGNSRIGHRTFIGTGAIVRDGITIGERCLIGAGAVVLADVPDDTVVVDRHERPVDPNRSPAHCDVPRS